MSARREELTRIAARLFAEQGYQGTSLADLAEALGVQKPSLYHHIDSKEDLLWEVALGGREAFHAALDAVPADAPAAERIRLALRGHLARRRRPARRRDRLRARVALPRGRAPRALRRRAPPLRGAHPRALPRRASRAASCAPTSTSRPPRCSSSRRRTGPTPGCAPARDTDELADRLYAALLDGMRGYADPRLTDAQPPAERPGASTSARSPRPPRSAPPRARERRSAARRRRRPACRSRSGAGSPRRGCPRTAGQSGQRCSTAAIRSTNGSDGSGCSQHRALLRTARCGRARSRSGGSARRSLRVASSSTSSGSANGKRIVMCAGTPRAGRPVVPRGAARATAGSASGTSTISAVRRGMLGKREARAPDRQPLLDERHRPTRDRRGRARAARAGDLTTEFTQAPGHATELARRGVRVECRCDRRLLGRRHVQRGAERRRRHDAVRLPARRRHERLPAGARTVSRPGRMPPAPSPRRSQRAARAASRSAPSTAGASASRPGSASTRRRCGGSTRSAATPAARAPGDRRRPEVTKMLLERRGRWEPAARDRRAWAARPSCWSRTAIPTRYAGSIPLRVAPDARFEVGLDFAAPTARPRPRRAADRVRRSCAGNRFDPRVLRGHDLDRIVVRCDRPMPLQPTARTSATPTTPVFEARRDALAVLV